MDVLKEIKKIIKEEKTKILLEAPEGIRSERPGRVNKGPVSPDDEEDILGGNDLKAGNPSSQPEPSPEDMARAKASIHQQTGLEQKGIKRGFTLYHGIVSQTFTEVHAMQGENAGSEVIKKVTQWALDHIQENDETGGVFASNNTTVTPQQIAEIVQKSMIVILNLIGQEAEKVATEKKIYNQALDQ